jgi:hypothetical protein
MAFLLGLQMGESRLQRRWDAEKQAVQIAQAKQEQHATDVAQVQNQISKEISDDYRKMFSLLSSRAVLSGRVLNRIEISSSDLSAVSSNAAGVASTGSHFVPTPEGVSAIVDCEQLSSDSAQTTLMLLEIQRWYRRQVVLDR